jgi:decaprenylphospho-beta-D-ribofuranose 2-oxidase
MTDWGRMVHANVAQIARPKTEAELQAVVRYAAQNKLKVSLRGAGHSALGHSIVDGGIMIDILGLNQVLDLDTAKKTLRVQTGATWGQLTRVLEPVRLAISTKQEFDNFTVGGSIAANIHGKSIDYGPIITHILSLRLLKADGEIVTASRTQYPDLFTGAIGGYGLLGIVVDVTFQLVEDRVVEKSESVYMSTDALIKAYVERVRRDPKNTPLCYGFFNADCKLGFYVTYSCADAPAGADLGPLKRDETKPILFDLFAWLQRTFTFVRRRAFHTMWSASANAETTLRSRRLLL